MGAIIKYIQETGAGKYICFNTKKLCLDSSDNDTITYNYDDKTVSHACKSIFAETDSCRVKQFLWNIYLKTKIFLPLSSNIF